MLYEYVKDCVEDIIYYWFIYTRSDWLASEYCKLARILRQNYYLLELSMLGLGFRYFWKLGILIIGNSELVPLASQLE